jgi:general secretion pathway protein G
MTQDTELARDKQQTRRIRRKNRQRGITLLEIMIVLVIIGLVMGLLVGPRVMRMFRSSKVELSKILVNKYANEAFGEWSGHHTGCPQSLSELSPLIDQKDIKDEWGNDLQMLCGNDLPAGAQGIGIESYGADGKPGGTGEDADLKSWE